MNEPGILFLGLIVLAFFIGGSISGIVALSKMQRLFRGLEDVKRQLRSLSDDLKRHEAQGPGIEKERTAPPRAAPDFEEVGRQLRSLKDDLRKQERPVPVTEGGAPLSPGEAPPVAFQRPAPLAFEEIVDLTPPTLPREGTGRASAFPFVVREPPPFLRDEAWRQMAELGRYRDVARGHRFFPQICL